MAPTIQHPLRKPCFGYGQVLAFISFLLLVSFCSSFSAPLSPWILQKTKHVH